MGTRADFYVGRDENAEWIGSIAWDGYPGGIDAAVLNAATEADFRAAVAAFFSDRDDVTLPADGWPWPWDDSRTTDYAYGFSDGSVLVSCFGHRWSTVEEEAVGKYSDQPKMEKFPDMSGRKSVVIDSPRSGLIVIA